jgi:hypothetical protein
LCKERPGFADFFWLFLLLTGWMSLLTIIEALKERPVKRGGDFDGGADGLAKRVKNVAL